MNPSAHPLFQFKNVVLLAIGLSVPCLSPLAARAQKATPFRADYHRAAEEYRAMIMRDENGLVPTNALLEAVRQKKALPFDPAAWPGVPTAESDPGTPHPTRTAGIEPSAWTWLGPGNIGGRCRSILIHPTTPTTMWIGSVCGGVWKTVNNGANWFPLNDFMANLAIGCLLMDTANPNVIYAGTGEGFSNGDSLRGAGIFKSINGGTNWTQLASTANSSFYYVNRLAMSPLNNLILLAATSAGIWRSTDGGTTWSQRYSTAAMLDVNFHPTDGNFCIAGGQTTGRALYSTNGGLNWFQATGLPAAGRVEVAYAPSSPTTVYASQENSSGQLYISTDGGITYTLRNTGNSYLGGQGWYDNALWVDPTNPNIVIVGGIDLWRSVNGGSTLTRISQWFSAPSSAHADHHFIIQHPGFDGAGNRTVLFANDGGIYRANDVYTVALTSGWQELNNNLGVTEFYGARGNASSGTIVGGTQDNGTLRYTTGGGTEAWSAMFGGDGGYCASDPTNPNYFYGEYVYLQIHRSANGGLSSSYIYNGIGDAGLPNPGDDEEPERKDPEASANFIAPFILDPNNANTLLAGGSNLWRSVNVKAATPAWTNIKPGANGSFISAIAVAQGNSDIIWVGHNNGDVYSTSNGTAANPTWTRKDLGVPNLPNRNCRRIAIDPVVPNRVYVAFGGFSAGNLYRTADGGANWVNLAASLPSAPFNSIVIAPFNTNFLYLGTEVGVFASANGGATWSTGNEGAANVAVEELFWMDQTLVAATHGRGLYKILVTTLPRIELVSATLASENCTNGVIDSGESVTVNFALTNLLSTATTNLVATLLTTNGVVNPSAPQNYGAVVLGSPAVTRGFTFGVTGACGGTITARLQLKDGTNDLGIVSASFTLGAEQIVATENFDGVSAPNLPAGWTASLSGAGTPWATVTDQADTAPNAIFTPDADNAGDSSVTSPSFAVATSAARLTFRHSYDTEVPYDGGVLEISIGGGAYNDILAAGGSFVSNGYNQTLFVGSGNPIEGRQAWSGNSGGFVTTVVQLPAAAAGQNIQLRWRFGSDAAVFVNGWYVDSIQISDGFSCCVPPPLALVPPDRTIGCNASTNPATTGNATGFSACPGPITLSFSDSVSNGACPGSFVVTRTWTATDNCSKTGSSDQLITVRETNPPAIFCPSNLVFTLAPGACFRSNVTWTATATNSCTVPSVVSTPASGSTFPVGTNVVLVTAFDSCGNSNVCSFTVTVRDTVPPVLTLPPNITISCGASTNIASTGTASATDDCGTAAVTYSDVAVTNCLCGQVITRTWRATDLGGNIATSNQIVTVRLPTATPELSSPTLSGSTFSVQVQTSCGWKYYLEYKDEVTDLLWTSLPVVAGDGTVKTLVDPSASGPRRLYRVRLQ